MDQKTRGDSYRAQNGPGKPLTAAQRRRSGHKLNHQLRAAGLSPAQAEAESGHARAELAPETRDKLTAKDIQKALQGVAPGQPASNLKLPRVKLGLAARRTGRRGRG